MKIYRIHISSWTSSFRYPNMISGYQPTLPVPPLSTINGLISAAMGSYFVITNEKIGYSFFYHSKNTDLETIYQMGKSLKGIKSNVIKREFLYDVDLFLYTDSKKIAECFNHACYQLLLGRSGDLAFVEHIDEISRVKKTLLTNLKGTIVPFGACYMPAPIQALPVSFSNTIPRENISTRPYYILDGDYQCPEIMLSGFSDYKEEKEWDVYWQEILA